MEILKDIPAQVGIKHYIESIYFNFDSKHATCSFYSERADGGHTTTGDIDVVPILQAATPTQRAVIRGFFKQIIADALTVSTDNIPEIFE